jgi:rubredoxin
MEDDKDLGWRHYQDVWYCPNHATKPDVPQTHRCLSCGHYFDSNYIHDIPPKWRYYGGSWFCPEHSVITPAKVLPSYNEAKTIDVNIVVHVKVEP